MDALFTLPNTHLSVADVVLRLGLACVFAGIIGFEREWNRHAAGFRTHMLVSLAAALYAVLMIEMMAGHAPDDGRLRVDPTRVLEAVTAGVAFLAAGTIIHQRGKASGLTTGATLWLSGALGTASGLGQFWVAAITCAFGFILILLNPIDSRIGPSPSKDENARTHDD